MFIKLLYQFLLVCLLVSVSLFVIAKDIIKNISFEDKDQVNHDQTGWSLSQTFLFGSISD